jgi:hypothetical protein
MTKAQHIQWLENEYPRGVELIYIDYRDNLDAKSVQEAIKEGYLDMDWQGDSQYESIRYIKEEYEKENSVELTDEEYDEFSNWLCEHDTSDPLTQLLKNTGDMVFYVETTTETLDSNGTEPEEWQAHIVDLQKQYARTDEQRKEITHTLNEQFYGSRVSFYFKLSPLDLFNTLHGKDSDKGDIVIIKNAHFGTVDRIQGSNWLGTQGIFTLAIPKKDFIDNIYADKAGAGYSWDEIAGWTSDGYEDATIYPQKTGDKLPDDCVAPTTETSGSAKRELELAKKWNDTHTCTFGDMNIKRHKNTPYINNFPCGNKCETCGTFWID